MIHSDDYHILPGQFLCADVVRCRQLSSKELPQERLLCRCCVRMIDRVRRQRRFAIILIPALLGSRAEDRGSVRKRVNPHTSAMCR